MKYLWYGYMIEETSNTLERINISGMLEEIGPVMPTIIGITVGIMAIRKMLSFILMTITEHPTAKRKTFIETYKENLSKYKEKTGELPKYIAGQNAYIYILKETAKTFLQK